MSTAQRQLTDIIPPAHDVAIPRGTWQPVVSGPVHWHKFDPATFEVGRTEIPLHDSYALGLYDAPRSIIDAFRLRRALGPDIRIASAQLASGISVIATVSLITSGYDMIRFRCRGGIRPPATVLAARSSMTPSPRCRSSSPSRTKSGSQPAASIIPPRITAGAVTTGWQNVTVVRGAAAAPASTAPRLPGSSAGRSCRSAARTATIPAGSPAASTGLA